MRPSVVNKTELLICSVFIILLLSPYNYSQQQETDGDVYTLDTIEVTSRKLSEYIKNNPQNIVEMNNQEIINRNFLAVDEAIGSMPGVDVSQGANSSGAKISIRGGGGSGSVLVLIDGKAVNSAQYGGVNLDSIPIDIVDRITVFKPPVPVWLGPGGAGGVINITTKNSGEKRLKKQENSGRIKINGGSYGKAEINASYMANKKDSKLMLTGGADHKDGKRVNSDSDSRRASFKYQKEGSSGNRYDVNGRYYYSEHGSSGPTDNVTPDARQTYQKGALDFQAKGLLKNKKEYSVKTYADVTDLEDKSQAGYISTLDILKAGISSELTWDNEEKRLAKRLGLLFETNRVDHNLSGKHHREKISLHLQQDRQFDNFNATLGLRGDYTNDFGTFPAVSTGISYSITKDTVVKTTGGYSAGIPTFNQLYQPSHGSIDLVRGNPNLEEENIYAFDLSLSHNFDKNTVLNASLFRTDTKNLITNVRGEDLIIRPVNVSKAYKQGAELSFKTPVTELILIDISYIYQDTKNKDTGTVLAYSPEHKFRITGKFSLPAKTRFEATIKGNSRQYSSPGTAREEKLDKYAALYLKIVQPVTLMDQGGEIYIHIDNLLDADFENHANYPDDGIRFIAGINLNF